MWPLLLLLSLALSCVTPTHAHRITSLPGYGAVTHEQHTGERDEMGSDAMEWNGMGWNA